MSEYASALKALETMPVLLTVKPEGVTGVEHFYSGKVRDVFTVGENELAFVATDRVSAFDQVLGDIPGKGQVNTLVSEWWFRQMEDIVPNHMIAVPDPNVMIGRILKPVPIEVVVRGYMTGVTDTSIWGSYERGERTIYGIQFREGYKKNDRLDEAIITPTTKAMHGHDERLTNQVIREGKVPDVSAEQWALVSEAALAMFERAQEITQSRGYILVDTKIEFGTDEAGNIYVMDELFTPDSSRFWKADTHAQLIQEGKEPENYDKEYLRISLNELKAHEAWKPGDAIPRDLRLEAARRYIALYEGLTGNKFQYPDRSRESQIIQTLHRWVEAKTREETEKMPWGVIVIMGSPSDKEHVTKITTVLETLGIPYKLRVGSVHKTLDHLHNVLGQYQLSQRELIFITVAGGLDALSGTVDGYLPFPVISAPPEGQSDTIYAADLHTPEGIAPAYVIRPQNAALVAAKMFGLRRPEVQEKVRQYQTHMRSRVVDADENFRLEN